MAHHIYLTKGIILKKKNFGEADRLFWIYTEKFGMIMAPAKGVRLEKAKLRGNLEVFTFGEYAVIASKDFWKLVDAREIFPPKLNNGLGVFVKTAGLIMRMVKGEEKNKELWNQLKNLFLKLFSAQNGKNFTAENLKDLETKSMAVILKTLGYMDKIPNSEKSLILAINRGIKESML